MLIERALLRMSAVVRLVVRRARLQAQEAMEDGIALIDLRRRPGELQARSNAERRQENDRRHDETTDEQCLDDELS